MPFLFAGGIAVALLLPVILILGILVILALRHDDDADANRAPAIYASVIAFIAVLTILFAGTGVVSALLETTSGHTHSGESFGMESRTAIGSGMMDSGEMDYGPGSGRALMRHYSNDDD